MNLPKKSTAQSRSTSDVPATSRRYTLKGLLQNYDPQKHRNNDIGDDYFGTDVGAELQPEDELK